MNPIVLNHSDLDRDGSSYEFQGYRHGNTGHTKLSFIWVDVPPGGGPRLHKHPYEEIFVIQEGRVTFTVGSATLEAKAGQVVIVPPEMPHKFVNSGDGPLRQVDIHSSDRFITEWLED